MICVAEVPPTEEHQYCTLDLGLFTVVERFPRHCILSSLPAPQPDCKPDTRDTNITQALHLRHGLLL